jgi:hypothetical protein
LTPRARQTRDASATSITRRYGLVGLSVKKSRVSGRIASASFCVSAGSITVVSTPSFVRYCRMNWRVRR